MTPDRAASQPPTITHDDFLAYEAYERVRRSGVTNMFDVERVKELSGLSDAQILAIMEHYAAYEARYLTIPGGADGEAA